MKVDEKLSKLITNNEKNTTMVKQDFMLLPNKKEESNKNITPIGSVKKGENFSKEVEKQTEEHNRLLTNIGKNLNKTSNNMINVNNELKEHGMVLSRIHQNAIDANYGIEYADEKIRNMEYRNMCYAIILHILVILLLIAIIIVIIIKMTIRRGE